MDWLDLRLRELGLEARMVGFSVSMAAMPRYNDQIGRRSLWFVVERPQQPGECLDEYYGSFPLTREGLYRAQDWLLERAQAARLQGGW